MSRLNQLVDVDDLPVPGLSRSASHGVATQGTRSLAHQRNRNTTSLQPLKEVSINSSKAKLDKLMDARNSEAGSIRRNTVTGVSRGMTKRSKVHQSLPSIPISEEKESIRQTRARLAALVNDPKKRRDRSNIHPTGFQSLPGSGLNSRCASQEGSPGVSDIEEDDFEPAPAPGEPRANPEKPRKQISLSGVLNKSKEPKTMGKERASSSIGAMGIAEAAMQLLASKKKDGPTPSPSRNEEPQSDGSNNHKDVTGFGRLKMQLKNYMMTRPSKEDLVHGLDSFVSARRQSSLKSMPGLGDDGSLSDAKARFTGKVKLLMDQGTLMDRVDPDGMTTNGKEDASGVRFRVRGNASDWRKRRDETIQPSTTTHMSLYGELPMPKFSMTAVAMDSVLRRAEHRAILDISSRMDATYKGFMKAYRSVAGSLASQCAVQNRDQVVFCSRMDLETAVAVFAVWSLGGIVTIIEPTLSREHIREAIVSAKPVVYFVSRECLFSTLHGICDAGSTGRRRGLTPSVFVTGMNDSSPGSLAKMLDLFGGSVNVGVYPFELLRSSKKAKSKKSDMDIAAQPAVVTFWLHRGNALSTATISHEELVAGSVAQAYTLKMKEDTKAFMCYRYLSLAALDTLCSLLFSGAGAVLDFRDDMLEIQSSIEYEQPPLIFFESSKYMRAFCSSVGNSKAPTRTVFCGDPYLSRRELEDAATTMHCPVVICWRIEGRSGVLHIGYSYDQVLSDPKEGIGGIPRKFLSETVRLGTCLPNVEWSIIRPGSTTVLGINEIGEVHYRAPQVCKSTDVDTHFAEDADNGWVNTGMYGYACNQKMLVLFDQLHYPCFVVNGHVIGAEDVEIYLRRHKLVEDCIAVPYCEYADGDPCMETADPVVAVVALRNMKEHVDDGDGGFRNYTPSEAKAELLKYCKGMPFTLGISNNVPTLINRMLIATEIPKINGSILFRSWAAALVRRAFERERKKKGASVGKVESNGSSDGSSKPSNAGRRMSLASGLLNDPMAPNRRASIFMSASSNGFGPDQLSEEGNSPKPADQP